MNIHELSKPFATKQILILYKDKDNLEEREDMARQYLFTYLAHKEEYIVDFKPVGIKTSKTYDHVFDINNPKFSLDLN